MGIGDGWSRSNVNAGGETVFPESQVNRSLVPDWNELTECAKAGLSVRPHMGDALLFWSIKPDASLDPTSLHGKSSSSLLSQTADDLQNHPEKLNISSSCTTWHIVMKNTLNS
jgi:hypothetical protein